jgi:hypothetical protein
MTPTEGRLFIAFPNREDVHQNELPRRQRRGIRPEGIQKKLHIFRRCSKLVKMRLCSLLLLVLCVLSGAGQSTPPATSPGDESGQIEHAGQRFSYRIRRLPVASFPELPAALASELNRRGCMIPQTWQAHRPENVIRGSFEKAGSVDWAVLCSRQGEVSLLVFFASAAADQPQTLSSATETSRLGEHNGMLGFNWGIDPATPEQIHQAQAGLAHRPPPPGHDALADTRINAGTVFHFFRNGQWTLLETE